MNADKADVGAEPGIARPRYTVGSVARALVLLDVIAEGPVEGMTVSEMARRLEMSKSSAFSLAHTLVDGGFLRTIEPGPRYQLGLSLVRLGDAAATRLPLGALVRPVLHDLSARTGLTTRVAVNDASQPMFIERVDAPGAVRFHTPLGVPELAHVSSAGKAILAELPEVEVRRLAEALGLPRRTPKTITVIDELLDDLAATRRRGYAVDDEEDIEGVFCLGAPFFDHTGVCSGAVSATGIKRDLTPRAVEELGLAVRGAADEISTLLRGGPSRADVRR